jgi:hypothetical protein
VPSLASGELCRCFPSLSANLSNAFATHDVSPMNAYDFAAESIEVTEPDTVTKL